MRILRAADHRRMPWKNGRGETVEIAVFPQGATVETFDWRISMATVSEDGAFSVFPGIDRTLSILEGTGMELRVEGIDAVVLTRMSAPHPFPADAPTMAELLDGTITDLNVMTRRGRFSHTVDVIRAPVTIEADTGTTLVLCHRGGMQISIGAGEDTLEMLDCTVLDMGESVRIAGRGEGFVIRFAETARG